MKRFLKSVYNEIHWLLVVAAVQVLWVWFHFEKYLPDLKERFLNAETAKGLYLVPVSAYGIYITKYELPFAFQYAYFALFGFFLYEGLRKIWVNRVKQAADRDLLIARRMIRHASDH